MKCDWLMLWHITGQKDLIKGKQRGLLLVYKNTSSVLQSSLLCKLYPDTFLKAPEKAVSRPK